MWKFLITVGILDIAAWGIEALIFYTPHRRGRERHGR